MDWCLQEPPELLLASIPELDAIADLVVAGDLPRARARLDAINYDDLRTRYKHKGDRRRALGNMGFVKGNAEIRGPAKPSGGELPVLFARDGWHWRYCQIPVIDPLARERLVAALQPYGKRVLWSNADTIRHTVLMNISASHDHVVARSHALTDDTDNLITACWYCQFGKGSSSLDALQLANPTTRFTAYVARHIGFRNPRQLFARHSVTSILQATS